MLTYHKTTEAEKYRITAWQYDGEYVIYNNDAYENQKARGVGFANPRNNFYSFYDGAILVGFINLYEEETEVFFGIGADPACCGKGYGQQMTRMAWDISQSLFPRVPRSDLQIQGLPRCGGANLPDHLSGRRRVLSYGSGKIKLQNGAAMAAPFSRGGVPVIAAA